MRRWIGRWMMAVGAVHTGIGFVLFGSTLREIIQAGLWDTINPGTPTRYLAFWFMFGGVAAILIGYLADCIERVMQGTLPRGLGWTLLAIALVGVIVTPVSGFWLVFPPAFGALAKSQELKMVVLSMLVLTACYSRAPESLSQVGDPSEHVSLREQQNLDAVRSIHEPGKGLIQRLRDSGLLADSAEWWVAGPHDVLPFAGTWRGLEV